MSEKSFFDWCGEVGHTVRCTESIVQIDGLAVHFVNLAEPTDLAILQKPIPPIPNGVLLFSDEWEHRQEQCKGLIRAKIGIFERKIPGRKCTVREVLKQEGKEFLDRYHIQGPNKLSVIYFGIYFKEELLGLMSLGRHSRQISEDRIVLDRLCFKSGVQVIGGSSKLLQRCLAWATERNYDEIISFSDRRWTSGKIYKTLGFILEKLHRPDYCYVGTNGLRFSKQSQKKSASKCPETMTELEWASYRGLVRIYDWGKARWVINLKPSERPTWKDEVSRRCAEQHRAGVFHHSHIRGYFPSAKNKASIYFGSSYELRCLFLLEEDSSVKSYRRCDTFKGKYSWRSPDILAEFVDGNSQILEVKPAAMLSVKAVQDQIEESRAYAARIQVRFKIWTETDSQLPDEKAIIKWAKKYLFDTQGDRSFAERTKEANRRKAKKFYRNHIANDKVSVYCEYCKATHTPLRLTYDKNIKKNGSYICEAHGGHIAGSKPKKKKVNPYAADGKRECCKCREVKLFTDFGTDKTRADGYASRCLKCRAEVATAKYRAKEI